MGPDPNEGVVSNMGVVRIQGSSRLYYRALMASLSTLQSLWQSYALQSHWEPHWDPTDLFGFLAIPFELPPLQSTTRISSKLS